MSTGNTVVDRAHEVDLGTSVERKAATQLHEGRASGVEPTDEVFELGAVVLLAESVDDLLIAVWKISRIAAQGQQQRSHLIGGTERLQLDAEREEAGGDVGEVKRQRRQARRRRHPIVGCG